MANRIIRLAAGIGVTLAARFLLNKWNAYPLEGKVVLITGGSRGLGLVLARLLAAQGAKIAISSRTLEQLDNARQTLEGMGADVLALPCDITNQAAVQSLITQVTTHFGKIDVLINNAGIIQVGPMENLTLQDYEEAMNTHFYGALFAVEAVLPQMRGRKSGRIVNISSIGGKVSIPHLLPYSASKHALSGYSKGLQSELHKDGIAVTTVYPGLIRTGSPRNVSVKGQHEPEYAWFKIADSLPLLTTSAEAAAIQIIEALKKGSPELVISLPAKLLAIVDMLVPAFMAGMLGFANQMLPSADKDGQNNEKKTGAESESILSQSVLAQPSDEAAVKNNEY